MAKKTTKKIKQGLLTSGDIMKGFTRMSTLYDIWTLAPIQCIPLEEKTEDWIKWNLDWYENVALRELPKKAIELQKSYNLAQGVINKSDYTYKPNSTQGMSNHLGVLEYNDTEQDLMTQFFPIIPNVINVFLGEKLRRDTKVVVDAVDPESINETLEYRMSAIKDILQKDALSKKQKELFEMGLTEESPQYQEQFNASAQLAEVETKFKKFRTTGAQWGQHFIEKYTAKNYFEELDLEMFADSLIADESIIALNLYDDDFVPEVLQPMKTYVNISPSKTYYSEANFITHIDFMSIPDIINKFRNKLTEEQVLSLENQYNNRFTKDILLSNQTRTSDYYDTSRSYKDNAQLSANVRESISDKTVENFIFDAVNGGGLNNYTNNFNNPKMIRVTRCWWPSQRRVGLLTKVDSEGNKTIERIDENYKLSQKPIFDKSLVNIEDSDTLVKGEFVEWKWINEWRYGIKIGENRPYYTINANTEYENIYIGGDPIKFQFKGDKNIYDSRPPVEGRRFSNKNSFKTSLVQQMKPWQIMYNVVNNRVARVLPFDYGKVLVTNKSSMPRNSLGKESGIEPLFDFLDSIRDNKVSIHDDTIENMEGRTGRQIEPRVLDLSTVEQAAMYLQMGITFKQQAFEAIGISQERLSKVEASTSATGVQQAVEGSVNQTEIRFDLYQNKFMQRVYEMILNAGQYYSSQSEEFLDSYISSNLEKVLFSVLKTDLLLRDLIIIPVTTAATKAMMQDLKRLVMEDNTMGMRFLEKAKTIVHTNPSEVFEALEKAEEERLAEEERKHQQEMELQKQQDDAKRAFQAEAEAREDKRFFAKLENDLKGKEIQAMGFPGGHTDSDANNVPDVLEYQKFQLQSEAEQNRMSMATNKLNQDGLNNSQKFGLEREKLQLKREEMANNLAVAQENKNSEEIKFQQLRKDKKQQAKK